MEHASKWATPHLDARRQEDSRLAARGVPTVREILRVAASIGQATLGDAARALGIRHRQARPTWEWAVTNGLLACRGVDSETGEVIYAPTEKGRALEPSPGGLAP